MNNNIEKIKLLKLSLKIVDELGELNFSDLNDDEKSIRILKNLVERAKKLKKNKQWKL